MENVLAARLQSLEFGTVQCYKSIAIVPLLAPEGAFRYRTLGEALATSDFTITEISTSGSVPELLVVNRGQSPVLLIDGEELAGAKQNRVLNTSVLLKEFSETRIPVSCTEQGRWSYSSPSFASSGNVMAQKARALKSRSVSQSLNTSASFHSDQGEVWNEICELQAKAGCCSPTSAMGDVFKAREEDLHRCLEIFHRIPGQLGLLAFTNTRPAGFDLLSLSTAYATVHPKLVRSYALESLLESAPADAPSLDFTTMAKSFTDRAVACGEHRFSSVGCGSDYRYRGEQLAGAALVHAEEAIHVAFFQLENPRPDSPSEMASLRSRRRYYRP
ncbi:MAG TPA: DUF6569 family protein [Candidatus Acidoferrales bacterium]|nr:DUF6569 family protein [Candidatus Acidoferrales bacterium]